MYIQRRALAGEIGPGRLEQLVILSFVLFFLRKSTVYLRTRLRDHSNVLLQSILSFRNSFG